MAHSKAEKVGAVQRGELTAPSSISRGYREAGEGLFIRNWSDRTRENRYKSKEGEFRLEIRKKFAVGVRIWLPTEGMDAPTLEVFKARLSSLAQWEVSLHMAGSWDWMIFKVHSNTLKFCYS